MIKTHREITAGLSGTQQVRDLIRLVERFKETVWLVGGAIRDTALGLPVADYDLAMESDPTDLAKYWAAETKGFWFWLDQNRRQSRVIYQCQGVSCCYDFAPLRADSLEEDLRLRDYTINAVALPLVAPLEDQKLIDPLAGLSDLKEGLLRSFSNQNLVADPLRILKGIRHCADLDLVPTAETLEGMRSSAEFLKAVPGERKRSELGKMFSAPGLEAALDLLRQTGCVEILFGPAGEGKDFEMAAQKALKVRDSLANWPTSPALVGLLQEPLEQDLDRASVLQLGAFLREYDPDFLESLLADDLRCSRRTMLALLALSMKDLGISCEAAQLPDNDRVRALWVEALGPASIELLLFGSTVEKTGLKLDLAMELIGSYLARLENNRIPDLIDGQEIGRLLGIPPGVDIGICKMRVKDAEIKGEVRNKEEAVELLKKEFFN